MRFGNSIIVEKRVRRAHFLAEKTVKITLVQHKLVVMVGLKNNLIRFQNVILKG